ncbi:hypothetical protein HY285_01205 [Candidatus Peregrinibacteria bacterium]|nr:hypothetical protein [Candidatus Peregrinibacteria bacterium]MBI3816145.1 hypothetical protein [Candidatus Peregrinibacteria bacterium]
MQFFRSIRQQLLGAFVGSMIALVLYEAFAALSPTLFSFLPQSQAAVIQAERTQRQDRIVELARENLRTQGIGEQ